MSRLIVRTLPLVEPSIVPPTDQERFRLLLSMKKSADFYDLEFSMAEYTGFVRGLFMSGHISPSQLVFFQFEASRTWDAAADRLTPVTA